MSPRKTLSQDVAPIGDDIEPMRESRGDVEMGNEEDEEPLEAVGPRARMNPKTPPRVESNKNMKIQDMLCAEICVLLLSKVEELVDNIECGCWMKEKDIERLRLLPSTTVS